MRKPCVIYARISRDKIGAGLGVQAQEHDCRVLADRLGWTPTEVYVDNDLSAYGKKPRPDYLRLLADMHRRHVTRVITWHTDRLHRTPRELEDYIDASEAASAATETVQAGPLDLSTPSGRMIARQLCVVARYESEHKSARLLAKMDAKARNRETLGGGLRPFGFQVDRVTINQPEAIILREMVHRVLADEPLRSIARDLAARKVPLPAGGTWRSQRIRQILLRPSIAGLYAHRGQILGDATWEPIIPEPTWRQVERKLSDPARQVGGYGPRVNLLSGIVKCECGVPMTSVYSSARDASGQRRWYYCPPCSWRRSIPVVDAYVVARIIGYLSTLDAAAVVPVEDPELAAKLRRVRERLVELQGMGSDPDFSLADIRRWKREAAAQLAELEAAAGGGSRPAVLRGLVGLSPDETLRLWEDELSLDRRRAIVAACYDVTLLRVPAQGRKGGLRDGEVRMRRLLG